MSFVVKTILVLWFFIKLELFIETIGFEPVREMFPKSEFTIYSVVSTPNPIFRTIEEFCRFIVDDPPMKTPSMLFESMSK